MTGQKLEELESSQPDFYRQILRIEQTVASYITTRTEDHAPDQRQFNLYQNALRNLVSRVELAPEV